MVKTNRMTKTLINLLVLLSIYTLTNAQSKSFPEDYDQPQYHVSDHANLLNDNDENYLNRKLSSYEDTTSTQILVVTLPQEMHKNMPVEMMGATIGEEWKIGQEGSDNGMIIVIYPEEKRISIQTGYGLEEYVPDAIAKRIIEQEIRPRFRSEQYAQGLDEATNVIINLLSGRFTAEQYRNNTDNTAAPFGFLIILVLFFIFFGQSRRRRAHSVGRSLPFWLALTMLSGTRHTHRGSFGNFSSGSGSFGGGGFGGGGGGSFGGGGASGGW